MPIQFGPDGIEAYAEAHTTPLSPLLAELVQVTEECKGAEARKLCGLLAGQTLQMLVAATGARRVLEIGTFTGFSALMMAAALPANGELVTLDLDADALAVARAFFARDPHGFKIRVVEGPALETLPGLTGPFDLVFIDADKENYTAYYEATLPLLGEHGLLVVDNALWYGRVLTGDPADPETLGVLDLNERVQNDPRVVNVLLTVHDGMMVVRRTDGAR